jgi:hypothetical protein
MTDFSNSFTIFNGSGSATGNGWTEEVSYLGQEKWLLRLRDDPAFSSDVASDQDVEERSSANLVEWVIDMDQVDGDEFHRVHALLDAANEVGAVECATLLQRFLVKQVASDKFVQKGNLLFASSPASLTSVIGHAGIDTSVETEEDGLALGALRMARWKQQNAQFKQRSESAIEALKSPTKEGKKICPTPVFWAPLHQTLIAHAKTNLLPPPPMPLILAGWNFSSDEEKKARWLETVSWCETHQCVHLLASLKDADWYNG